MTAGRIIENMSAAKKQWGGRVKEIEGVCLTITFHTDTLVKAMVSHISVRGLTEYFMLNHQRKKSTPAFLLKIQERFQNSSPQHPNPISTSS